MVLFLCWICLFDNFLQNPSILFYSIDVLRKRKNGKICDGRKVAGKITEHEDRVSKKYPTLCSRQTHLMSYKEHAAIPPVHLRLHPHHQLPTDVWELLLRKIHDEGFYLNNSVLTAFHGTSKSSLRRINRRNSSVTDLGLASLLRHKIQSIDVMGCSQLSEVSLDSLNHYCRDSLVDLNFSGNNEDAKNPNSIFLFSVTSPALHQEEVVQLP